MSESNPEKERKERESYWALMLASLKYRNFRLVWLGSVTEHFGEFMELAAILWLVNEMTRSPLILTIVGTSRFIAMIVFPLAGGVVADRVDRRNMLIGSLLSVTLFSLFLAVMVFTGLINIWHLIVVNLLYGVATSFNHPARHTLLPNLVNKEHLLNAIALDAISVQAARMFSMAIAGYLIVLLGVWPIFILKTLGCVLAVCWLLLVKAPSTPAKTKTDAPLQNLLEGFRYLRVHGIILGLVLLYLIPRIVMNTYVNFLPIFAKDVLNIGAVGYGYLQAGPGLGAIISLLGLTLFTYYKRKMILLIVSGASMGIGLIGLSLSPWMSLSLFFLVILGGMQVTFNTVNSTMVQTVVSDDVRGRVMSWREVAFGLGPTGSILFGGIAQMTGAPFSTGLLGVICLVVSLLLVLSLPKFKSIE